ncbi:MAG: helix-turn-helix domain-containing protein [Saccharofermentanales bacterium]
MESIRNDEKKDSSAEDLLCKEVREKIREFISDKGRLTAYSSVTVRLACALTIRGFRTGSGRSQEEAAIQADISQSHLSSLEHARHVPSLPLFLKIGDSMDIGIWELLVEFIKNLCLVLDCLKEFKNNPKTLEKYKGFLEYGRKHILKLL